MAEFTDIMEQAVRICKARNTCWRCPLYGLNSNRMRCAFDYLPDVNFDEVERKIRALAGEHPDEDKPSCPAGAKMEN